MKEEVKHMKDLYLSWRLNIFPEKFSEEIEEQEMTEREGGE